MIIVIIIMIIIKLIKILQGKDLLCKKIKSQINKYFEFTFQI